jgi:hypothetical protein
LPAARIVLVVSLSFRCSRGKHGRNFIKILQLIRLHTLGACRGRKGEVIGGHLVTSFPVTDLGRVLGEAGNFLAGDHHAARVGLVTHRNPELQVDFLCPEGNVVALDPTNNAAAKILGIGDVGDQLIIDIGCQEVCTGERPFMLVSQVVDQGIDRSGLFDLGIFIGVLANKRQRLLRTSVSVLPSKSSSMSANPPVRLARSLSGRASAIAPELARDIF